MATWDFEYAPAQSHAGLDPDEARDLVVATETAVAEQCVADALTSLDAVRSQSLLDRAPLHWLRVCATRPLSIEAVERQLTAAGVGVRYVASARHPSMRLGSRLRFDGTPAAMASDWSLRDRPIACDDDNPHRWFINEEGVDVDRALCGFGIGTRVAVIDDDAGRSRKLGLDAIVPVLRSAPDADTLSCHGATLVAWAVGAAEPPFAGVAPGASARLYCIPKPGGDVAALPLAIARAVFDGADVVVCATYVEGSTSPMLDDALDVAVQLGRGGRGTVLVVAAGREICSPDRLVPSSLSIDLGDLAADPRVFCVGPSGREGGWFLFQDRRGRIRPFANRGPSMRFLAPGDDTADPFAPSQARHAESSGATAFAAGVLALVLASAPELTLDELEQLLIMTAKRRDLADQPAPSERRSELLPAAVDRDGHNAKHGYGRLDAKTACCAAVDPIALSLAAVGETKAAQRWIRTRARRVELGGLFSPALGRALARAFLRSSRLRHAGAVLVRHLRLVAHHPRRAAAHTPGAVARLVRVVARELDGVLEDRFRSELRASMQRVSSDREVVNVARMLWPTELDEQISTVVSP